MPESATQLSMDFDRENPLAVSLRQGEFTVLIEWNTPLREQPFEPALTLGLSVARRVAEIPEIAGITVTDRLRSEDTHDPVDTAARLREASGKPVVMHISGKGSSAERVRDLLARAASNGVRNVLAVTGDRSDRHELDPAARRVAHHPNGYLDSVDILRLIRASNHGFLAGAGVNPFKYNPADQYLQYYKMLRKLNTGAAFLVTQMGWDMKKLQELQWYLQMRDIGGPVLARLTLLSADDIERIDRGFCPGVHVARIFAAAVQRESNISATQSMAAQLQRLGLQVAGCRLLGYSGVQIAGCRDEKSLDMIVTRVKEALERHRDYAAWIQAWNEFHNFIQFEPTADAYYVFEGLLDAQRQMYDEDRSSLTHRDLPGPAWPDRLRAAVLPHLLSRRAPACVQRCVQALLCRGTGQPPARLRYCAYLNPGACPKDLVFGACGGSFPDGRCEFGHGRCFFHRVLTTAARRHELDRLEEGVRDD